MPDNVAQAAADRHVAQVFSRSFCLRSGSSFRWSAIHIDRYAASNSSVFDMFAFRTIHAQGRARAPRPTPASTDVSVGGRPGSDGRLVHVRRPDGGFGGQWFGPAPAHVRALGHATVRDRPADRGL